MPRALIVAHVQGNIKKYARKGYSTVIIGEEGHPEVIGLLGFYGRTRTRRRTEEQVRALPDMNGVNVVAQTTTNTLDYEKIVAALRSRFPGLRSDEHHLP